MITDSNGHARLQRLHQSFQAFAGSSGLIAYAPGRVNLIGDHTDYTGGYVLPASLATGTWVVAAPRTDTDLRIHSVNQNETVTVPLSVDPASARHHWSDYIAGCAWSLGQSGIRLRGSDLFISSDLPLGSGLSSSAALEVAVCYALLEVAGARLSPTEIAQHGRTAENQFVGARCGIMDQFVAAQGEADHAVLLDCHSLEFRTIPLPRTHSWIIANSMVRHSHANGGYNIRRAECEQLVSLMEHLLPARARLADLTPDEVVRMEHHLSGELLERLRHVVSENHRVLETARALERADMTTVGELLDASHRSLSEDYDVSCPEVDTMVGLARRIPGVLGSRMMGGGFGGSTITLVEATRAQEAILSLAQQYEAATGLKPTVSICEFGPAGGLRP